MTGDNSFIRCDTLSIWMPGDVLPSVDIVNLPLDFVTMNTANPTVFHLVFSTWCITKMFEMLCDRIFFSHDTSGVCDEIIYL